MSKNLVNDDSYEMSCFIVYSLYVFCNLVNLILASTIVDISLSLNTKLLLPYMSAEVVKFYSCIFWNYWCFKVLFIGSVHLRVLMLLLLECSGTSPSRLQTKISLYIFISFSLLSS